MRKEKQVGKVGMFKRGLASAMLVATLASQVAPLATVSADTLDFDHTGVTTYKTLGTGQYAVNINPMIGAGNVGSGEATPQGGSYLVEQVAQYTSSGTRVEVSGVASQTVNLSPTEANSILLDSDGEYRITPKDRIPGYLNDLGATHKVESDGVTETQLDEPAGHYIYAFPLIDAGVTSDNQTVDFQPKLREARTTLNIDKVGDDKTTPLGGVGFKVYKTFDAQTGVDTSANPVEVGAGVTGADGRVSFENLIEGEYFFVEDSNVVPSMYLPDVRKVEFGVETDGEEVFITVGDKSDIGVYGNNERGSKDDENTFTRFNYIDPAQNKEETYQSLKSNYVGDGYAVDSINTTKGQATGKNEGVVYVNTDGVIEFSSSVDIPNNFNDFSEFTVVDEVDSKLTIDPSSIELRLVGQEGVNKTLTAPSGALVHKGQTITLNAKHADIVDELDSVENNTDYLVLTYKATVDTDSIDEGVEFETLHNTQTLTADSNMNDDEPVVSSTEHKTQLRVREGRIVVDKDASDGENTPLAGAEFQLYRPALEGESAEVTSHGRGWVKAVNPRGENANYFGVTDSEGYLAFENLQYGDYLLVETKAPDGYRLNNNHELIEIRDSNSDIEYVAGEGNTYTAEITNMRRNQIFPGTGTTGNILTLVVLGVAGGALVTVTVKKRKENEEEASEEA